MNAKERIEKAINHEEADRVPTFELGIDNLNIIKHFKSKYVLQGFGSSLKKAYDLFQGNEKSFSKVLTKMAYSKDTQRMAMKSSIKLYTNCGIDSTIVPLAMYHIKYGRNWLIDEYARKFDVTKNEKDGMDFLYYRGGVLRDFEDYEAFPPLDPDLPLRELSFKLAKELERETNGKVYITPALVGMMEATWEGFGLENFCKFLNKPNNIQKVFDDRGRFAVELTKRIIEWGETTSCFVFDDYGYKQGLFMSPENYRKYVFPWLKKICDTAHKGGIKVILHSCGDIYKVIEDIINAGVDALHPIEPTTSNPKYNIFKLKRKYGDKITLVGNVSPQDLSYKNPEFIKDYTKELIKEIAPGGGFILSSGHSINPAVKLENFLAMREIIKNYGNYPIQI
jgi:uroporphyrinogen decarboxylase